MLVQKSNIMLWVLFAEGLSVQSERTLCFKNVTDTQAVEGMCVCKVGIATMWKEIRAARGD